MANPQRENGHTPVANEILEALAKVNLRPYETRTLLALLRKTYGWQKKEDRISISQFMQLTNLEKSNQRKALKSLTEKNIIFRKEGYIKTYGLQKDYMKWQGYKHTPFKEVKGVNLNPLQGYKHTPKQGDKQPPTKENKETIQKKESFFNHLTILKTQIIQLADQYSRDQYLIKQHLLKENYTEAQIEEAFTKYADVFKKFEVVTKASLKEDLKNAG